jgi:hypothetical protein
VRPCDRTIAHDTPWTVSGIARRASHHAATARLLVRITPERPCASGPRTILSLSTSTWTSTVSSTGTDSGTYPLASNAASYRSGPSSAGALSSNTYFIDVRSKRLALRDLHRPPCPTSSPRPWSPPSSPGHPRRSPHARSGAPTSPLKLTSSTPASTSVQVRAHPTHTPHLTQHAALHLLNDDFDACHSLAQTQEGDPYSDHLHGIAHRREPDYPNSK